MGQKGLQNLIPSYAYIGQNTLACKILGIFTVRFFRYTASMILCPSEQNGQKWPAWLLYSIYSFNCNM